MFIEFGDKMIMPNSFLINSNLLDIKLIPIDENNNVTITSWKVKSISERDFIIKLSFSDPSLISRSQVKNFYITKTYYDSKKIKFS